MTDLKRSNKNEDKPGTKRRRRKLSPFKVALLVVIVLIMIGCGIGFGILSSIIKTAPALDPKKLETRQTSFIYDNDGNLITKVHGTENRVPVDIKKIPRDVKYAFLAIEDVSFYEHSGVSFRGLARAALKDFTEQSTAQGASTITQQLVKRTFLTPEKRFKRKIQEIYLSLKLERQYTKDEILEMYLNQIYFGEGAYGIQAAANTYFNKDVKDLNVAEGAVLAAIPKSPTKYDPFKNPDETRRRQLLVLGNLLKYNFITESEYNKAVAEKVKLTKPKTDSYPYPYFVEYVIDQLVEKYGDKKVFNGGLRVYTTLDPKIQEAAEKAINNPKNFPKGKKDKNGTIQPQAAAVVLDPHTGFIKAIVGGRGRDNNQRRLFNRATQAKRQPGSSFKPIIAYGPTLEKGSSPASVSDDSPIQYGSYRPKNSDLNYRGLITIREAARDSINMVAIQSLKEAGVPFAHKFARKLGITNLNDKKDLGLGIALGGLYYGVTPLEITRAYGAFDNNGVYVEPTVIIKVTDQDNTFTDQVLPQKTRAMKETTAFLMTDMLKDVVDKGTGHNAKISKWPTAGKTGTTNEGKDIWFVGYTPALVAGVWIGHDVPQPMPKQFGGKYPAMIWKEIMTAAHKGKAVTQFKKPSGIVRATVCSKSGLLPSDLCPKEDLVTDYFTKGTVPKKVCNSHVVVEVCSESNALPNEYCPTKVSKSFLKPGLSSADPDNIPKEECTIHGPGKTGSLPGSTIISSDPSHGGKVYLANIPGPDEEGGCPPNERIAKTFEPGKAPTEYCPNPEHRVRPKTTTTPTQTNNQNTGTATPVGQHTTQETSNDISSPGFFDSVKNRLNKWSR